MDYIKYTNCRVCQLQADRKVISDLNFKLLEGVPLEQVQGEYSQYFVDPQKPLNYHVLRRHKSHLKKQIANNLAGIPSIPGGEFDKNSIVISDDTKDLDFGSFIDFIKRNKEDLEALKISAMEDLETSDAYLAGAQTPKNQALILSVRDNIRNSVAAITEKIQELVTPQINNINDKGNAQVVELLMIVKKSALLSGMDKKVMESFLKELVLQIDGSKELKWLNK
jgi:hypothetical protein